MFASPATSLFRLLPLFGGVDIERYDCTTVLRRHRGRSACCSHSQRLARATESSLTITFTSTKQYIYVNMSDFADSHRVVAHMQSDMREYGYAHQLLLGPRGLAASLNSLTAQCSRRHIAVHIPC